jgi:hypothetical protein
MHSIPSILLFSPFQKAFVRQHTRKGKPVGPYFTKRLPGAVKEKHTRERFHDHSNESANAAHKELEDKKKFHQTLLDAAKKHHDKLTKKGPPKKEEEISHEEKLAHLKTEIKNQQTHIDNHTRKQDLIKNRYEIDRKRIVAKKSKADLQKKLKGDHTEDQKKTISDIHNAHASGKSKLKPGRVLTGKDKDHIYMEAKHKETGKTHHIAIHKDGSIKDPNVLHEGKFDHKKLTDKQAEKKKIIAKQKDIKPKKDENEKEQINNIIKYAEDAKKQGADHHFLADERINPLMEKLVKKGIFKKSGTIPGGGLYQLVDKKEEPKKPKSKKIVAKKTKAEKKETRSRAMMGNKNAYKGGPKDKQITKKLKSELKTDPVLKGMAITLDLEKNGKAELIGRTIKNTNEMAAVAQVFRNPRYETIRYVLTKGDKVKAHLAVTSKMPNIALGAPGKEGEIDVVSFLKNKMKEYGTDGYYMIHNHPSGDPEPSSQDINLSGGLNKMVKGYKGHIIINSGKYASLEVDNRGIVYKNIKDLNGEEEKIIKPSLEHPLLGKLINQPEILANISKDLQNTDKYFTLIGTDNKLKTRTIIEMPMEMMKHTPEAKREFESFLRTHTRETGSNHFFISGIENNASNRKFLHGSEKHGLILDASFNDNSILSEMPTYTGDLGSSFSDLPKIEIEGYLTEEKKKHKKIVSKNSKSRSESMKGNKNAWKGGPKDNPKEERTSKQLDKITDINRIGKETKVITARSKDKHKVRYKIIEADDNKLIASNHIDGRINKAYPNLNVKGALQMRDRSNIQSKLQITQMANDIEPMFLTDSKIASDGAPIVGTDYKGKKGHSVVESGNGRIMALRTAYEYGKADHYKEHLIEDAESFGIDPDIIKSMKKPILVRERVDSMSDQEKAKFSKEANKATVSQMTATEQAIEDSNYIGSLANLKATEGGRINSRNNSQFIEDFFSSVMDNDQREIGKLLNKDGQLNDEGERRLTNAVFVRVYGGNSDIMNKLIMKESDRTRKITSGMLAAAPRMAKFKENIEKNDRHDLDISANFIDALTALEELKKSKMTLEDKLKTYDWKDFGVTKDEYKDPMKNPDVVAIAKLIQEHGSGLHGSSSKIESLLTNYANSAERIMYEEDPRVKSMEDIQAEIKGEKIDKKPTVSKEMILKEAKDEVAFSQADRKGKVKDYQLYLEKYPKGKYANEAKEKINKLNFNKPDKNQMVF